MDSWKKLFSRTILERGYQYYRSDRITYYKEEKNFIVAKVKGSKKYGVTVIDPDSDRPVMHCDCPYAEDGGSCKHMAAVMYRRDSERICSSDELDIFPAILEGEEKPYYYLPDMTQGLNLSGAAVSQAKKLIKNNNVALTSVKVAYEGYGKKKEQVLVISGEAEQAGAEGIIRIVSDREKIRNAECGCCGSYYNCLYYYYTKKSSDLCSHTIALLMLAYDRIRKTNPGDGTDWYGALFLSGYGKNRRKAKVAEEDTRKHDVILEPRIMRSGTQCDIGFRIGHGGKMYVVKNLTDMTETAEDQKGMELGKSDAVSFSTEFFTDSSAKWYELIRREVEKAKELDLRMTDSHRNYDHGTVLVKKTLPMTSDTLDDIYEMTEGSVLPVKSGKKSGSLNIGGELSGCSIEIKRSETENGLEISGRVPFLMEGNISRYALTDDSLVKADDAAFGRLEPFFRAADSRGYFCFTIGSKSLQEFYYRILPGLKEDKVFDISIDEDASDEFAPPKAGFSFYLDAEDDLISCRAFVSYGKDEDGTEEKKYLLVPLSKLEQPVEDYRDRQGETACLEMLQQMFPLFDDGSFFVEKSDDAEFELLSEGLPQLLDCGEVNTTDRFDRMKIKAPPVISVGVSVESSLLDLSIRTDGITEEELLSLLSDYRRKKKYHRLKTGEFISIEKSESVEALMEIMDSMNVSPAHFVEGHMHIPAYRALYLDRMMEERDGIVLDRDRTFRSLVKDFKTIDESDFDVPEGFSGILREYQKKGFRWLRTLEAAGFGGILADDMGLGKTVQMIAALLAYREEKEDLSALIVCPASLVFNWKEELQRFAPGISSVTMSGTKKERRAILEGDLPQVLITSYDLLKRDIAMYDGISFTHQVLDEAQYVKNPKAAVSKSVKLISAEHRFAMTGTPIENRLSELWSIFDFLMPGFLYTYEEFRSGIETPIVKDQSETAAGRLRQMTSPFILRRKKEDVLKDLPEKHEEVCYAGMDGEQRKLYDAQVVHMRSVLEDLDPSKNRIKILAELTKLRQMCCDPSLLFDDYKGGSAKREACIEMVKSAIDGGHRILLFSQFTSMLALLRKDLEKEKIDCFEITGSTPKEKRLELVNEFNKGNVPVFLISLKAGGTGLNLTGADVVIHYDPWWNRAAQNQATDRAHRIGQKKSVTVYRIIAADTIEEKILAMQDAKEELADAVLSGEGSSISAMTKEELLALLQ